MVGYLSSIHWSSFAKLCLTQNSKVWLKAGSCFIESMGCLVSMSIIRSGDVLADNGCSSGTGAAMGTTGAGLLADGSCAVSCVCVISVAKFN